MRQKLGQHFLEDPRTADRIVSAAGLSPTDHVVEIGPGEGVLTERLLPRCKSLTAIELDARLAERLKTRLSDWPGLQVLHEDFLKFDLSELPSPAVFVANLPYAVASPILQRILAWPGWARAVLMFQKEVAERLVAAPGNRKYGLLTVSVALKARVEWICDVPKRLFRPPPQVDSAVLRLDPLVEPLVSSATEERLMSVAKAAFAHRRKTVSNSLAYALERPKEEIDRALREAKLDPGCRAEDISPEDFVALCEKFSS